MSRKMTTSSIITRSARLLDVITNSSRPIKQSRLADATGYPKSSVHRILAILMGEKLVAFEESSQGYVVGPRMIGWAAASFRTNDLPDLCSEAMQELTEVTGSHVALSICDGQSVLYLKTADPLTPYRTAPRVGERSPLHVTAAGKVFLGFSAPKAQDSMLENLYLTKFTEHTLTDKDDLRAEINLVSKNGYATCDREEFLQVSGVSAPIFNQNSDVVAAISLWNQTDRQDLHGLLSHAPELLKTTGKLSRRLGHEVL